MKYLLLATLPLANSQFIQSANRNEHIKTKFEVSGDIPKVSEKTSPDDI